VLEVAFVLAPRQNLFYVELQRALADELERQGVRATLHVGAFPPPRKGLVYVLMPPHEYFKLMDGRVGPPPEVYERTIFISGEQPTTEFFDHNLDYARVAGAMFDINRLAVRAYADHGIAAHHLQLGWTPSWDFLPERGGGPVERDIDVLFMGANSERRLRFLARYARTLRHRTCRFVISDNSRPNWAPSGTYLSDEDKWDLLGRSKVMINLHQGDTPYFEWLRVVQAMANGCVVVSEPSLDDQPLVPGTHMQVGRPDSLGFLAERLLDDSHARWTMQSAAYDVLHDELPLSRSVAELARAAHEVDERPVPSSGSAFFLQPPPREADVDAKIASFGAPQPGGDDGMRRVLKDLRLEMLDLRRRLEQAGAAQSGIHSSVVVDHATGGWWVDGARVTVLVTLYNYERHIEGALDSLLRSHERSWEVVIVDDGSSDRSLERARAWLGRHDDIAGILLRHPVNRGLAHARNAALDLARGEFSFVLDADNEVVPDGLGKLVATLDADPDAALAFGFLERFTAEGTTGLVNIYPWEPDRFRLGNYIDAMALMRTATLRAHGGYRTDRRLYGWEDFDLWCRLAEAGDYGIHLDDVVARYRSTGHSMLSITNISAADAISIITEASPTVMAGAVAPY
jgi:hypothetical protein